jgi:hypothetical protein
MSFCLLQAKPFVHPSVCWSFLGKKNYVANNFYFISHQVTKSSVTEFPSFELVTKHDISQKNNTSVRSVTAIDYSRVQNIMSPFW